MKNLEQVMEDIRNIEVTEGGNSLGEEIVIAFGDYEFEGETEVIIADDCKPWQCYVNHKDSPKIMVEVEDNKIINVW